MMRGSLRRTLLQRLLGVSATPRPRDAGCWTYEHGRLAIDLSRAAELRYPDGALRLEGGDLTTPILVLRGEDDRFHAYRNCCGHKGRKLDPVPGTGTLQCCSLGKSTYSYGGRVMEGPATRSLTACPLRKVNGRLIVRVRCPARVRSQAALRVVN